MADRPSVTQLAQLGVEGTAGTQATANRLLRSMMIEFSPQADIDAFKATGFKYVTLTALNREWSELDVTGEPTYSEIIYPLGSIVNAGTAAVYGTTAAGTAYQWVFTSTSNALDTFKTYTFEKGDANVAELVTGAVFTTFELDISRQDAQMSGQLIAGRVVAGTTLSGNGTTATTVSLVPILPSQVDIYLNSTSATLGTTKLTRDFHAVFTIDGRHTPVWPINSALTSYATTTEAKDVDVKLKLQIGADSNYYAQLRAATSQFIRIQATGGTTVGGSAFALTIDMCGQITAAPTYDEQDDLYVSEWEFTAVHDSSWGKAYTISVVNEQSGY